LALNFDEKEVTTEVSIVANKTEEVIVEIPVANETEEVIARVTVAEHSPVAPKAEKLVEKPSSVDDEADDELETEESENDTKDIHKVRESFIPFIVNTNTDQKNHRVSTTPPSTPAPAPAQFTPPSTPAPAQFTPPSTPAPAQFTPPSTQAPEQSPLSTPAPVDQVLLPLPTGQSPAHFWSTKQFKIITGVIIAIIIIILSIFLLHLVKTKGFMTN
ncbi:hypothetical protein NEIRO02_2033, partial [Nematocida sp. AWRm79]